VTTSRWITIICNL